MTLTGVFLLADMWNWADCINSERSYSFKKPFIILTPSLFNKKQSTDVRWQGLSCRLKISYYCIAFLSFGIHWCGDKMVMFWLSFNVWMHSIYIGLDTPSNHWVGFISTVGCAAFNCTLWKADLECARVWMGK